MFTMLEMEIKKILWENTRNLMIKRYGNENLNKTAVDSAKAGFKISIGSLARIKAQETAIGLDVLERIAGFFKVTPAQLISKNLKIEHHPLDDYKNNFDKADKNHQEMLLLILDRINNGTRDENVLLTTTKLIAQN